MKKWSIACAILLGVWAANGKEKQCVTSVYFETAKHELKWESTFEISQFLEKNLVSKDYEVVVKGFADHRGNKQYNQDLSKRRAERVVSFLKSKGINPKLVRMAFYGEHFHSSNKKSSEALQKDRRVDIIIRTFQFESVGEMDDLLIRQNTSVFVIDPKNPELIETKNGCRLKFNANSFVDENGREQNQKIEVKVIDALDPKDWLANKLSTRSGGRLLKSGGMINVMTRSVDGKNVQLKEGSTYSVSIPKRTGLDNMSSLDEPIWENSKPQAVQDNMEIFVSTDGSEWSPTGDKPFDLSQINMPPYPQRQGHSLIAPKYKIDYSTKPKKPIPPMKPQMPHTPRKSGYTKNIEWYHLNKNKRVEANKKRLSKAMANFDQKAEKYDERMAKYEKNKLAYHRAYLEYEYNTRLWEKRIKKEQDNWEQSPAVLGLQKEHDSIMDVYDKIYDEKVRKWRELRASKIADIGDKMDDVGMTNQDALGTYIFTMKKLGWINCDAFVNLPEREKRKLVIADNDTTQKKVMLVFNDKKSALHMWKQNGRYVESGLPKNEDIVVFAYKVEDGKPQVMFEPVPSGENFALEFRESSFSEIKELLASLK